MMSNEKIISVQLTRGEVCDLLLACLAAKDNCNDEGVKWTVLHNKLQYQIDKADGTLESKGFDSFKASEKFNSCKEGDIFELNGHDMMKVTGMIMQNLETNDYYMKGIDFE